MERRHERARLLLPHQTCVWPFRHYPLRRTAASRPCVCLLALPSCEKPQQESYFRGTFTLFRGSVHALTAERPPQGAAKACACGQRTRPALQPNGTPNTALCAVALPPASCTAVCSVRSTCPDCASITWVPSWRSAQARCGSAILPWLRPGSRQRCSGVQCADPRASCAGFRPRAQPT